MIERTKSLEFSEKEACEICSKKFVLLDIYITFCNFSNFFQNLLAQSKENTNANDANDQFVQIVPKIKKW